MLCLFLYKNRKKSNKKASIVWMCLLMGWLVGCHKGAGDVSHGEKKTGLGAEYGSSFWVLHIPKDFYLNIEDITSLTSVPTEYYKSLKEDAVDKHMFNKNKRKPDMPIYIPSHIVEKCKDDSCIPIFDTEQADSTPDEKTDWKAVPCDGTHALTIKLSKHSPGQTKCVEFIEDLLKGLCVEDLSRDSEKYKGILRDICSNPGLKYQFHPVKVDDIAPTLEEAEGSHPTDKGFFVGYYRYKE